MPENIHDPFSFYRLRRETAFLNGTSDDVRDDKTFNVLYWKPVENAVGYRLYRRLPDDRGYAKTIHGSRLISRVETCDDLLAVIPRGSWEWILLENAFSNSAGYRSYLESMKKREVYIPVLAKLTFDERHISPIERLERESLRNLKLVVDPCDAFERGLTAQEEQMLELLSAPNLKIRLVAGLAYIDHTVKPNQEYLYELRAVTQEGIEQVIDTDFSITAGHYIKPDPPGNIKLDVGDHRVLATWNENRYAFTYQLERRRLPGGLFQVIHEEPIFANITEGLDGEPLPDPKPGFLDFQRWNDDGEPVAHDVCGVLISGPDNGTTYQYQVCSQDILGRLGASSPAYNATPVRTTPPMAPSQLAIAATDETPAGLVLSWNKVTRDVDDHKIQDITQTYYIYRADNETDLDDIDSLDLFEVGIRTADPTDPPIETLSWTDSDPILFPDYGEKDFWYRIRCKDVWNNLGAPSAVVSGRIPDTTPPGPTIVHKAEGHADHITVFWIPNNEPDLAGYQIYRSLCHMGRIYIPRRKQETIQVPTPCDMQLVGQLSLKEAQNLEEITGEIYFEDFSVPPGSPVCYAYWVRAYDQAQNLYSGWQGCPTSDDEYTCQRLYEDVPPPVPIITALKARDRAMHIEWIASPIQDLGAFHVYRSKTEFGPLTFVGCVLKDGTTQSDRYTGIDTSVCAEIPAETSPTTVRGTFVDLGLDAKVIYWYRVSSLDLLANESESADLHRIPAISTFTYSRELPLTPTVLPQDVYSITGCGLTVKWEPTYATAQLAGFVVFRGQSATGDFLQVSPIIKGNDFVDQTAIRGQDYWYKVQAIGLAGKHSHPSSPLRYKY